MSYSSELKESLFQIQNKKDCCVRAFDDGINLKKASPKCSHDMGVWLRGAFIACGSMANPEKQYYICFRTFESGLKLIEEMLEENGISPSHGARRNQPILYLRDSEKIEDFVSIIGATKHSLDLMEHKVIKEMSADANRRTNADVANFSKQAGASAKQIAAINKLISTKKLQLLSAELIETAEIRLANPDISLDELKNIFPTPITKSGLNHRLRRLVDEAEAE